jgi:hypothetical protein
MLLKTHRIIQDFNGLRKKVKIHFLRAFPFMHTQKISVNPQIKMRQWVISTNEYENSFWLQDYGFSSLLVHPFWSKPSQTAIGALVIIKGTEFDVVEL